MCTSWPHLPYTHFAGVWSVCQVCTDWLRLNPRRLRLHSPSLFGSAAALGRHWCIRPVIRFRIGRRFVLQLFVSHLLLGFRSPFWLFIVVGRCHRNDSPDYFSYPKNSFSASYLSSQMLIRFFGLSSLPSKRNGRFGFPAVVITTPFLLKSGLFSLTKMTILLIRKTFIRWSYFLIIDLRGLLFRWYPLSAPNNITCRIH